MRLAVVGVSAQPTCGVRDHAMLLADALGGENIDCSVHWLSRGDRSLTQARSQTRAWSRRLTGELEQDPPDAILLHYSVFAYSYRGLPSLVYPTLSALGRSGAPVIAFMHELAYPWRKGGVKGSVWALAQRSALFPLIRASFAVIVTADFRAEWVSSRPWLPARRLAIAPVFTNLPAPSRTPVFDCGTPVMGLFGYTFEQSTISLVLDAVNLLRDRDLRVDLALLGAPGPSSAAGRAWSTSAAGHKVSDQLSLSGVLDAQELSDTLASCELLLYADPTGPASRKGTLAASLSSGRPVIALEGRRRWTALTDAKAARVIARAPDALADAIQALLTEKGDREALGMRGRAFAEQTMGLEHTTTVVKSYLNEIRASS